MNPSKHKKNIDFVEKTSTFEFQIKKMPFKHFQYLQRIMIGAFLITWTQLEKTGSIGKVSIQLET